MEKLVITNNRSNSLITTKNKAPLPLQNTKLLTLIFSFLQIPDNFKNIKISKLFRTNLLKSNKCLVYYLTLTKICDRFTKQSDLNIIKEKLLDKLHPDELTEVLAAYYYYLNHGRLHLSNKNDINNLIISKLLYYCKSPSFIYINAYYPEFEILFDEMKKSGRKMKAQSLFLLMNDASNIVFFMRLINEMELKSLELSVGNGDNNLTCLGKENTVKILNYFKDNKKVGIKSLSFYKFHFNLEQMSALFGMLEENIHIKILKFIKCKFNEMDEPNYELEFKIPLEKLDLTRPNNLTAFLPLFSKANLNIHKLRSLTIRSNEDEDNLITFLSEILRENKYLESLDLTRDEIDDNMLELILRLLKENTSMREIDMFDNKFTTKGLNMLIENYIKENNTIKRVYFSSDQLTVSDIDRLEVEVKHNIIQQLSKSDFIKNKFYIGTTKIIKPKLKPKISNKNILTIIFRFLNLIDLSRVVNVSNHFRAITLISTIYKHFIYLREVFTIENQKIKTLRELAKELEKDYSSEEINELVRGVLCRKDTKSLTIYNSNKGLINGEVSYEEGQEIFRYHKSYVRNLTLYKLKSEDAPNIKYFLTQSNNNIHYLIIEIDLDEDYGDLFSFLKINKSLRKLSIRNTKNDKIISNNTRFSIISNLVQNYTIEEISFYYFTFSFIDIVLLSNYFKSGVKCNLKSVNFEYCKFYPNNEYYNEEEKLGIFTRIISNWSSSITTLKLSKIKLTKKESEYLVQFLSDNKTLTSLYLNSLPITTKFLTKNSNLTKLYLADDVFYKFNLKSICHHLKRNSTLQILKLKNRNRYSDSSEVLNMLECNSTLLELVYSPNHLKDMENYKKAMNILLDRRISKATKDLDNY